MCVGEGSSTLFFNELGNVPVMELFFHVGPSLSCIDSRNGESSCVSKGSGEGGWFH